MASYAHQLAQRGHYVKFWMFLGSGGVNSAIIPLPNVTYHVENVSLAQLTKHQGYEVFAQLLQMIHPSLIADDLVLVLNESMFMCPRFLRWKTDDFAKLQAEQFDLIIADELPPNICVRAITRKLNVPYAIWNSVMPVALWHEGVDMPQTPSVYPTFFYNLDGLKQFSQRLSNTLCYMLALSIDTISDALMKHFQPHYFPLYQIMRFASNSLMTFTQWPVELDFVGVQSHRLVFSNLLCPKVKPIGTVWEKFVSPDDSNGTVLLSLGYLLYWDIRLLKGFFVAAEMMPKINFIWHLKVPQSLPHFNLKNVKISTWLPLDDLLAHPKTLALVSHAGAKSVLGSFCAQKPILAIPHRFDQFRSAAKVAESGFGAILNRHAATPQLVMQSVIDVMENIDYKRNLVNMKNIAEDRLVPSEGIVVYQLERLMRQNVRLFHSKGGNLHFYSYYSLDLLLAAVLCICAPIAVWKLCRSPAVVCTNIDIDATFFKATSRSSKTVKSTLREIKYKKMG